MSAETAGPVPTDPTEPVPAAGPPLGTARIRGRPEDFQVREIPLVAPDGDGEHWLVEIRKRGLTTAEAVRRLARAFDCPPRAISHAGLKDRHALTTQWLSIHAPAVPPAVGPVEDGLDVISAGRHRRKLRVGTLAGNRFRIRLTDVTAPRRSLDARLATVARSGVPNYFGPQRFGRDGGNLAQALAWHRGEGRRLNRSVQGLLLSAVRAEAFNRVLRRRVESGCWDRALPGDQMILDGRGSLFAAGREGAAGLVHRLALQTIHPTGPLPGTGGATVEAEAAALETDALAGMAPLLALLEARRMRAARRALRLRVAALSWHWEGPAELVVAFRLPPGSYATTVLAECLRLTEAEPVAE
ncbi:tRNA pseudouridine(13) synthase TruD [Arhodomonas aquaeolei]|uniref:tRNA pseudouridine(13) synthase TruD n=1 Tax=Arhodomonas aquaeolei TaxID=2369 RepID=UPI00035F5663|nr:tRNA pseudouridine(13) synthase TruD [Arhodomonas aquaeolei]MCS4505638.1 tRNA pseudouridine(13) synthase TruD [Arhodomonas aquaeolei]